MNKSYYFLISLFVFNACFAVTSSVNNIKSSAFPGENLEYVITFYNDASSPLTINIQSFLLQKVFNTTVSIKPSINLEIPALGTDNVNVSIPVSLATEPGFYYNPLYITYDDGSSNVTKREFLEAVILSNILELQNLTVITPSSILPFEDFNITLMVFCNIEKINPVIRVLVSDESRIVYESTSVNELIRGGNILEKQIKIPDNLSPGAYNVIVQAELSGNIVNQGSSSLVIESYSLINHSSVKSEDLFGKSVTKDIINSGNEIVNVSVNYSMSVLEPLLISKAVIIISKNGEAVRSLSPSINDYFINELVTLNPGESAELIVEFNYTNLLLAPFFVIACFIAWFFFTKRVIVRKEVIDCKREDGELMIKVGISVRNVSLRSVSDVRIIEDLPVYAKKAGGFGSIQGEIDKEKGIITFSPGRLDSKEEVLITYKFKTDVELEGRINLPPATVKYVVKGKVSLVKSGTPVIELTSKQNIYKD